MKAVPDTLVAVNAQATSTFGVWMIVMARELVVISGNQILELPYVTNQINRALDLLTNSW